MSAIFYRRRREHAKPHFHEQLSAEADRRLSRLEMSMPTVDYCDAIYRNATVSPMVTMKEVYATCHHAAHDQSDMRQDFQLFCRRSISTTDYTPQVRRLVP